MNAHRIMTLARRVIRQFMRDHRTVGLLILGPIIALSLGALVLRADSPTIPLGVVANDQPVTVPFAGELRLSERIMDELAVESDFELVDLGEDEIDDRLRDGSVQGVIVFDERFTAGFRENQQAEIDLRLEGSNPARSAMIAARVSQASMKALAGLIAAGLGGGTDDEARLPLALDTSYLFAGEEFDTMDFIAPVYIALLAMFFVFLLTCVSFLRERSQGTMERLLATPTTRLEIVLGYMIGLGLFALVQVAVILFFTIWVLQIHYLGSLALLFVIIALLAIVGVSLGMLASAFARNEFQVVQFIPLLIIPQILLSGAFWAVEEMPAYLRPFAYMMPLTYANWALRDVMLKGWGLAEIWPYLLILLAFAGGLIVLGAKTMRQEVQ